MRAVTLLLACCLLAAIEARELNSALASRALLADPEGASLTGISTYLKYVQAKCGDPAKVTKGDCLTLKTALCGTSDTSEVICFTGDNGPIASFRSASRYTRVEYVTCSLTKLSCTTSRQAGSSSNYTPRSVDPVSLAAWVEYTSKCHGSNFNPKITTAATCGQLSGDHCSRPDVKCGADTVDFYDASNPKAKKVIMRAVYNKGLIYVVD